MADGVYGGEAQFFFDGLAGFYCFFIGFDVGGVEGYADGDGLDEDSTGSGEGFVKADEVSEGSDGHLREGGECSLSGAVAEDQVGRH